MSKGQMTTSDFMISIAIFIMLVAIVTPLYMRLSDDARVNFLNEELGTKTAFASDVLFKTGGMPAEWNSTNVQSIGLVSGDRINNTKLRWLMKTNTPTIKRLLGLEGIQYNISFYSGDYSYMTGEAASPVAYFHEGSGKLFPIINGSGLVWDLYYGGGSPETGDARNVYGGTAAESFDLMVNNPEYRTIIIEDTALTQTDIDLNALKNFVDTGGVLIYTGNADIISSGFSMSSGRSAADGTVRDTDFVEAGYGSTVSFNSADWYFYHADGDSLLKTLIEHSTVSGAAFAGEWSHGAGKIIYVTDVSGTIDGNPLLNALNIAGKKAEIVSGPMQSYRVNSRPVVFDRELNSMGTVFMVVGQ